MTAADLQDFIGGASTLDAPVVEACWDEASALVSRFVGASDVPAVIVRRATLEVGAELFARRSAPSGISQFQDATGGSIRLARDPMTGAYPILTPFVGMGIA
jgi:hypothetical protein